MAVLLTWVRGILSRIVTLVAGEVVHRVGIECGLLLNLDLSVKAGWLSFGSFCIAIIRITR